MQSTTHSIISSPATNKHGVIWQTGILECEVRYYGRAMAGISSVNYSVDLLVSVVESAAMRYIWHPMKHDSPTFIITPATDHLRCSLHMILHLYHFRCNSHSPLFSPSHLSPSHNPDMLVKRSHANGFVAMIYWKQSFNQKSFSILQHRLPADILL